MSPPSPPPGLTPLKGEEKIYFVQYLKLFAMVFATRILAMTCFLKLVTRAYNCFNFLSSSSLVKNFRFSWVLNFFVIQSE